MRFILVLTVFFLSSSRLMADAQESWAFTPGRDVFSDEALLDLSALNESVAGQTGFVGRSPDGAGFVLGNGEPIRFWAVNTSVARKGMPALREHARFLAKRGVNMVRFHGQIPQAQPNGGAITAINRDERARLWQLISAVKEEGIYVTFSPYYPHTVSKEAAERWEVPQSSPGLSGLIYFDPVLQSAYKNWLRETLLPLNPYTGLALKDDPALAIIQMQNEDSLLFWSLNELRGREARLISDRFGDFLKTKYGSLDRARKAFKGAPAPGPIGDIQDDWISGTIALAHIWHLTTDGQPRNNSLRLRDQTEFLTTLMRDWHLEVARFLREDIGAKQLFNAGNWKTADSVVLDDLERFSYTSGDVVAVNRYVSRLHDGAYRVWAIVAGDRFREEGVLQSPLDMPLALRQPSGYPYIIPETLWVPPIGQQAEAPILMAAYQGLTGVDISYWFGANEIQWRQPQSANGFLPSLGKWVVNTPQIMGSFPAAALIFRLRLIEEASPVVIEHRSLDTLWSREPPMVVAQQGYDPNRDDVLGQLQSAIGLGPMRNSRISPYSFLTGPVVTEFDSTEEDYVDPALEDLVDEDGRVVTSATGQLQWDWGNGLVTLDAPQVQGVVGALSQRARFELQHVKIQSAAPYASVIVLSMDSEPIPESGKLFVQIGSVARPTGWQTREVMHKDQPALEVVSFGTAPWQISVVEGQIVIENSKLTRATVLDANGMAVTSAPLVRDGDSVTVKIPRDALYMVLE